MKDDNFKKYWRFACLGVLLAAFYPLYMGVRVVWDMVTEGVVFQENYPKYIIPYTPIALAVLAGLLLLPVCRAIFRRFALLGGAAVSAAVFFASELLLETNVVVTNGETVTQLQDWQMYMCSIPPDGWGTSSYRTQTAVEILMGEYDPAFKLHFYMISLVLILAVLTCLYGFGKVTATGDRRPLRGLVYQSVATGAFLGLCILACFTAFWRDGSLEVSPISAGLMSAFFILLGSVGGLTAGALLRGRPRLLAVGLPALLAVGLTGLMYTGESILLNGHLYRFGRGLLFDGLPGILLAPVDVLVILVAGILTGVLLKMDPGVYTTE